MPAPQRFLGQQAQIVESRATAMAKPLEAWMRRFSQWAQAQAMRALLTGSPEAFAKARPPDLESLIAQLREIIARYGLEQWTSAMSTGAKTVNAEISITQRLVDRFLAEKEIKLQGIIDSTIQTAREQTRSIIAESLAEDPRPSTAEIGRRLRNRLNFGTTETGQSFAFSPERAQLIARTEMVQTQNTGIVDGYRLSGITRHKWISYQDGRSGRGHDQMMGQVRNIGVPFEAPDGTKLMYPGDPNAPIRHTANCRCTTVPVIEARQ